MKTSMLIISSLIVVSCSTRPLIKENSFRNTLPPLVQTVENDDGLFHRTIIMHNALSPKELFTAEYRYISDLYGERGVDWFLMHQTIIQEKDRIIDVVEIKGRKSFDQKVIFFDITDVFSENGDDVCLIMRHN
jgi:hypothetical protein